MSIEIIDSYPANESQGVPTGDSIVLVFNQEMDLTSINAGTVILSGPDNNVMLTGDLQMFEPPELSLQEILNSPYYDGIVKGTFSFEKRLDGSVVDLIDEEGVGTLWNTTVIFTPSQPLAPNVKYRVIISGDDSPDSDFDSGVKSRTVFDRKIENGTNENCFFSGGFNKKVEDIYHIKITTNGDVNSAKFIWWKESDPLITHERKTSSGSRQLENGLFVSFGKDSVFEIDEAWSVVVKPYKLMDTNYSFEFYTGSGSIIIPPSSSSGSLISGIDFFSSNQSSPLKIISMTPSDGEANLNPDNVKTVVVKFNKELDPSTINNETVRIIAKAVNGDQNIPSSGELAKILSVDGDTLTIQLS
jgi:hypothetical protein